MSVEDVIYSNLFERYAFSGFASCLNRAEYVILNGVASDMLHAMKVNAARR